MSAKFVHAYRDAVLSANGPSNALARLVAIAVAKTLSQHTLESYAGAPYLAELSGLSERTVRTCLGMLCREGWLEERTKASGRNYWLKVRRAVIPASGLPAGAAGSRATDTLHRVQGVDGVGLPARGAGLPAGERSDSLHAVPPISVRDLGLNSEDPPQPLPPPSGRRGSRLNGTNPRAIKNRSLAAWRAATTLIDQVNGSDLTWQYVTDTLSDPIAETAIEAAGGHRVIADRTTVNVKELRTRFRESYERAKRQCQNNPTQRSNQHGDK